MHKKYLASIPATSQLGVANGSDGVDMGCINAEGQPVFDLFVKHVGNPTPTDVGQPDPSRIIRI